MLGPDGVLSATSDRTAEKIGWIEQAERRREATGISYVTVPEAAAGSFAPVVARLSGR